MARLQPVKKREYRNYIPVSLVLDENLKTKLDEEMLRVGINNRSEMIRMILDEYFSQEVE